MRLEHGAEASDPGVAAATALVGPARPGGGSNGAGESPGCRRSRPWASSGALAFGRRSAVPPAVAIADAPGIAQMKMCKLTVR
eukprot:CAMPEP_0179140020 /NCGR_PEP_ID=MMETSP0796-20121207/67012_1 /TAXON_ID=73915 /ORGANISM="Pyrodinium bahamense, Strain pbaha01" /LENGTH=82 /DNA_ID=CAMNT_0020839513 /DNA_START=165 /DNA_END=410 /DNA_ORIENTATION=+